jgi:hypothetical protein
MKVYGMSVLLRNTMGVRTEVYSEDYGQTDYLRVVSHLDPDQLSELKSLCEVSGWQLAYRNYRPSETYLAIVPKDEEEVKAKL